ncbi:MAG: YeeE/YedE family protein [Gammaproteobacteria bacterium]|nr:YeeE/YedE family protein [Gammaproteobacteria bacterium]
MEMEFNPWLVFGGLIVGILLGAVVQRSKFCMAAAVSNLVLMKDTRQLHAYLAAIAVAILGTQLLQSSAMVNMADAAYLKPQINVLGAITGGIIFGIGTVFAGGCVGRTLVRVGEGNIGALIVLLSIAIMAAITMYGPLEAFRININETAAVTMAGESSLLSGLLSLDSIVIPVVLFCIWLAVVSFSIIGFFGNKVHDRSLLLAGVLIGLLVVAGWYITGYLSQDDFSVHRPVSLAFAGPLANTAYMLSTGSSIGEGAMFGIMLLAGTLSGALLSAIASKSFSWTLPKVSNIKNLVMGGIFMGFGAVVAGGCNLGHGLSGASTFSMTSIIAMVAIVIGMRVGLFMLMRTDENKFDHYFRLMWNRMIRHQS